MPDIATTAFDMISGMTPKVREGTFVFATVTDPSLAERLAPEALAIFKEDEGLSLLLTQKLASKAGLNSDQPMRCITLNVFSSLEGVGLTAAVATALANQAIPCNMVAAYHHDYVFVPADMCDQAMKVLLTLQSGASSSASDSQSKTKPATY